MGFLVFTGQAQTKPAPKMLQAYKWENRLVLVFAPTAADAQWQKQQQLLKQAENEMAARDLLTLGVLENQVNSPNAKSDNFPSSKALRERYNVKPTAFEVILIGKDGGEKYRSQEVINPAKIFQIIDAMPMRKQEMRQGFRN